MRISDWSSDVCSSDLASLGSAGQLAARRHPQEQAQETERPHDPLPARCLQDARSLLGRLGAPDAGPDQEPQPNAQPNQETSPRSTSQSPQPASPAPFPPSSARLPPAATPPPRPSAPPPPPPPWPPS